MASSIKEVEVAVEAALRCEYRHIDCVAIFLNEKEVGECITKSGVKRIDILITGKLWNTNHRSEDVEKGWNQPWRIWELNTSISS